MPKPLSGSILTRRLADDTLVVDVKIRTERRMLGPASEWNEARARKLLEHKLLPAAQLRQDWTALIPGAGNGRSAGEAAGPLSVREAATDYVEALSRYQNPNTVSAYRSPVVKHLLPFLAYTDDERTVDRALAEIDEALMLRFVSTKQAERAVLQDIADTFAELDSDVRSDPELLRPQLDAEEWHLLCRYGQRGGHHTILDPSARGLISLSSRGLSNNEINRCLARMRDIVRMANRRYKLGIDDPRRAARSREVIRAASGCTRFRCRRISTQPRRSTPIRRRTRTRSSGAIPQCWPSASWDHACRSSALARWRDLSAQGLSIPEAKTSAGRRHLELPAIGRISLDRRRAELEPRPSDYIWASAAGTKRDRNNVRNRLLAPVLELGAHLWEERGQRPLPARVDADGNPTAVRVTPHMFRRTAMTYWAWADRNQRWAVGQAGHKSAKMTLEAYQQTFPRDPDARAQVVAWLAGAGEEPG